MLALGLLGFFCWSSNYTKQMASYRLDPATFAAVSRFTLKLWEFVGNVCDDICRYYTGIYLFIYLIYTWYMFISTYIFIHDMFFQSYIRPSQKFWTCLLSPQSSQDSVPVRPFFGGGTRSWAHAEHRQTRSLIQQRGVGVAMCFVAGRLQAAKKRKLRLPKNRIEVVCNSFGKKWICHHTTHEKRTLEPSKDDFYGFLRWIFQLGTS